MESNGGLIWKILTAVLGVFLLVALVFVVILGLRVKNNNQVKANEIKKELTTQGLALKKQCQLEKEEVETTYVAADVYGNFQFVYPKVWSTNVLDDYQKPTLKFLAHPTMIVNNTQIEPTVALRVLFLDDEYESKVRQYAKEYKKADYTISGLKGIKATGINKKTKKKETVVLLPLRDKTLYIGTDDVNKYSAEYEKILKTFVLNK